jgi:hypothetical protein
VGGIHCAVFGELAACDTLDEPRAATNVYVKAFEQASSHGPVWTPA